jgi:hypothetical protein
MAVKLATATVNAMASAAVALIDDGSTGTIKVYSGTQPANANASITGTLLATFDLEDPAFGSPTAGVVTLSGTPLEAAGVAAGTATHFRVQASDGDAIFDGAVSVTGGSGELLLNTVSISDGVSISITSGSFTMPAS